MSFLFLEFAFPVGSTITTFTFYIFKISKFENHTCVAHAAYFRQLSEAMRILAAFNGPLTTVQKGQSGEQPQSISSSALQSSLPYFRFLWTLLNFSPVSFSLDSCLWVLYLWFRGDCSVDFEMTTMESLIGLVNRIQRACTMLGDYGGGDNTFSSLWEALPSVAVVGGQVLALSFISLSLCFLLIFVFFFCYFCGKYWYFSRNLEDLLSTGEISAFVFRSGVRLLKNLFMVRVLGRWKRFSLMKLNHCFS